MGKNIELALSSLLYDPKFGNPKDIKDFSDEHRATIEDMVYGWDSDVPKLRKAIAKAGW